MSAPLANPHAPLCRGGSPAPRRLAFAFSLIALLLLAAGPAPVEAAGGKALDQYFRGKVTALEGSTVTLRYDFRRKDQVKDFTDRVPFRIKPRKGQRMKWFDDKMEIIGNSGARHKAEWIGDVVVTATFTPEIEKDFGGYMSPVSETEDFVTFTFVETFFHAFDGKSGGANSIIKFGAQWRETDSEEFIGFRYGPRKPPKKKIKVGEKYTATFGRVSKKLIFKLADYEMKGSEKGKKLKRFHVGFYAMKGRMLVDNVEITGTLATDWCKREKVELRTSKPIEEAGAGTVDAELQASMDAHKGGSAKATRALVGVLKDPGAGEVVHAAVTEALSTGPKKAVRSLIDLLYSTDEKARARGITVIKALIGSDYGFRPKAKEKSRSDAIRKLNKALKDDPDLLK